MIKYFYVLLACTTCIMGSGCATTKDLINKTVTYVSIGSVVTKPGIFKTYHGECQTELVGNSMGGFTMLYVSQMGTTIQEVKDVTGIGWATGSLLIYTVSPIYGDPGVYILNCVTKESRRIVAPQNITPAYPNGADYFELYRLFSDRVYFYHAPDVDSVNFKDFRSQTYLFQCNFDGSEMNKAQ